jgi:hypothetical protein
MTPDHNERAIPEGAASPRSRWQQLREAIVAEGIPVLVSARQYPGGTTHFISWTEDDYRVEIHDKWWRKNHDVWIGYQVHVEGRDSVVRRTWPITKKRSEVVAAVRQAVAS